MSSIHSEMTLDEVRNYLIQSGALSEAEKLYHLPSSNSTKALSTSNSGSATATTFPSSSQQQDTIQKYSSLKDSILNQRELEKEKILRNLLSKRHQTVSELEQEEEEMKQLQLLENKLYEENLQISLMKSKLKNEIKIKQKYDLNLLSQETSQELERIEKKRIEMETNLEIKKKEILNLQNELNEATESLFGQEDPHHHQRDRDRGHESGGTVNHHHP
jgi:DNA repair exonuclease SbcCD ATPase subunit